jgi:hypothetical protein
MFDMITGSQLVIALFSVNAHVMSAICIVIAQQCLRVQKESLGRNIDRNLK